MMPGFAKQEAMEEKGQIFVLTAPSGTGKTTIIRNILRKNLDRVGYSVSHTTREARKGEVHGAHYYFIDKAEFEKMIQAHKFVEWAVVYDQLYGTSITSMERELSLGKDLVMDLDIQGAQEIKRQFPESLSIFILPPSIEILKERLKRRSTGDHANMELRLKKAVEEIQNCRDYDFIIVNDNLNKAVREIEAVIIASRANNRRRLPFVQRMFGL